MSKKDDGKQVYPSTEKTFDSMTGNKGTIEFKGISRRDWLAGLAMGGIVEAHGVAVKQYESITKCAYKMADAMIEQGKK